MQRTLSTRLSVARLARVAPPARRLASLAPPISRPSPRRRWAWLVVGAVAGAVAVTAAAGAEEPVRGGAVGGGAVDYAAVRADVEAVLLNPAYDDGSYGPVLIRLAWHAAGHYDKSDGSGGSGSGATMRFKPESEWGANAGLGVARALLEPIKAKHPALTYADLWSLAGAVAIEAMGGPHINWRPGRTDAPPTHKPLPDGRLPDASQGAGHLRAIFGRMGFTDQEIVALAGAHAVGRCHRDRSGYDGPWTFSPTVFSNDFYVQLLENTWTPRAWDGPLQYEDQKTRKLMMLPADLALVQDAGFRPFVEAYAKDEARFFKDFAAAFQKLQELGVAFPAPNPAPNPAPAPKATAPAPKASAPAKPWWQFW